MSHARRVCALVILVIAVSGCASSDIPEVQIEEPPAAPSHPYPQGDEWPDGLRGPFDVQLHDLMIPSFDGTRLHVVLYLPLLPDGVGAPTVIWSTPYFGQTYPWAGDPAIRDNSNPAFAVPINRLVADGYAVLAASVRGTGESDGCFEFLGPNEQKDQAFLVDWVAQQEWSNGRVGMMGLSYHGTTPLMAAIQNPPALKTVVVAGLMDDLYTFYATPQGAWYSIGPTWQGQWLAQVTYYPSGYADEWGGRLAQRLCPEAADVFAQLWQDSATEDRNQAFWDARRIIDEFPNITASVFVAQGFLDIPGHSTQDGAVWNALENAPKRQLTGQWGHMFPNFNYPHPDWALKNWNQTLLAWLNYWLKGIGDAPPGQGTVEYQDGSGAWHNSSAWPPAEAHQEALFLTEGVAQPVAADEQGSFVSNPASSSWHRALCPTPANAEAAGLAYLSEPATAPVLVAGNPFAHLVLSSTSPGGIVAVHLVDLGPDFRCSQEGPSGHKLWGRGIADLRHHAGNFRAEDFPVQTPTPVRVDVFDFAETLDVGHRLAVVVSFGVSTNDDGVGTITERTFSYGGWDANAPSKFTPVITVHGGDDAHSSHVVLPIVRGTFGGAPAGIEYPPRPFVPR